MISQPPPSTKVFRCSICDEPSLRICFYCTKDTCENHLCPKCRRCSDCCTCEVPLDEARPHVEEKVALVSNGSEPLPEAAPTDEAPPADTPMAPGDDVPMPPGDDVPALPDDDMPRPRSDDTPSEPS